MNLRFWRRKQSAVSIIESTAARTPFLFSSHGPATYQELRLYEQIRKQVPVVNAAIGKLVMLTGVPEVIFADDTNAEKAGALLSQVRVGDYAHGLGEFVRRLLDSAVTKGYGIGEVVPGPRGRGVSKLVVGVPENFRFVPASEGWRIARNGLGGNDTIDETNVVVLTIDAREEHPQGFSLLWSLPFVQSIMVRALQCIDNQFWRIGDPTWIVWVEGGQDMNLPAVQQTVTNIKGEFEEAMQARKRGQVQDIIGGATGGTKLVVQMLGADRIVMDIEVPYNAIIEQVVSALQLPPFVLGLKRYESRESMASWQADMLVSYLNGYRRHLEPVVRRVVDLILAYEGLAGVEYKLEWPAVNLMDESETALAELREAQAQATAAQMLMDLYGATSMTEEAFVAELVRRGIIEEQWGEGAKSRLVQARKELLARRMIEYDFGGDGSPELPARAARRRKTADA